MADVIGVTHASGTYHLTDEDFLNEGADQILSLGSRVIKLYLCVPPAENPSMKAYPFNSDWPDARTLVELARTPYFREVFDKPFTTYVLTVYAAGRGGHYWRRGVTPEEARDETEQFERLTRHLLTTYRGTGKTFVLSHWEGDWAVRGNFDRRADPEPVAFRGMIDWLRARQAGVDKARAEAEHESVRVFHAAEVNLVAIGMNDGRPTVTDQVLPEAAVDLVSYSAWDTENDPAMLRKALDYIARHAPDRPPFGDRNVFLGEFGQPENERSEAQVRGRLPATIRTAVDWGCPWVIYWQVYCNEARRRPVAANEDVRGFWLLHPDGTKAWAWKELRRLLR
jgi:hypothetical protein